MTWKLLLEAIFLLKFLMKPVRRRWLISALLTYRVVAAAAPESPLFPDFDSSTTELEDRNELFSVYPQLLESAPLRALRPIRRDRFSSSRQGPPTADDSSVEEDLVTLVPVNAAGFKCEDSSMVEAAGAKCSLLAKSFGPLGCQRVLADLAAERGKSLEGVPQAFRQRRVADACPYSCGLCETCAPGCAKWFIGNGWCEPDCNVKACQWDGGDCWETDCVVGPWGELSACSITCDSRAPTGNGGVQVRSRAVKVKPSPGGKQCPPLEEKVYGCNANVPCPVECEVSPWGPWSPCSAECGAGQNTRTRTVIRSPAHGALRCPELKQHRPCFLTECPARCEVSEWSAWSECSARCNGGTQFRTRTILSPPVGPGAKCPDLFEETTCNTEPCKEEEESLCETSDWSDWTTCSAACGGGVQTRSRHVLDPNCQAPDSELFRSRPCNTFECVQDCVLSEWSSWSVCDALCGEGVQTRTRDILVEPSSQGMGCGSTLETRRCYTTSCPVDCEVSEWSPWSDCTLTGECGSGTRMRSRSVTTIPANNGKNCPPLVEFDDCSKPCESPKCLMSKWSRSNWSVCEDSCQIARNTTTLYPEPVQWRHSLIEYYSPDCPNDEEVQRCGGGVCTPAPEDCLVSEWTSWSPCSKTCGGGNRSRSREVLRPQQSGGRPCPALIEEETCGISPCPINCVLGDWSPWSSCAAQCGLGTQLRSRPILVPASNHPFAEACGPVTQVAPCVGRAGACPRDCLVGDWSSWSACSEPCGGGVRRRQRSITQLPVGALVCPATEETESCNNFPCPVDCLVSDWSEWTECSASCLSLADGQQTRTRSIMRRPVGGGAACPANLVETRTCRGSDTCDKINCEMGPWSTCPASCGEDVIFRDPKPPVEGMAVSMCVQQRQTAACFAGPCPVDCQVTEWGEWEPCSVDCGGGDQKRVRDIISPAANGGKVCPNLWDTRRCNEKPCADAESLSDCVLSTWSPWSPCSQPCGGGVTSRSRTVDRPPAPGGKPCGALTERKGCNLQRCPGASCEDNPRLAENGITCNILRTQGCTTALWDLAKTHNVELPADVPPEARVQDACPLTCGVCEECAPGCELRDLGNTVCTPECDVEACDFDRGDCGGDCLLPEDLSTGEFLVQPSVTALQEGQQVELRCSGGRRFSTRSALDFVTLACGTTDGQPLSLHLLPTPDAIIGETNEDILQISCQPDPCPFVFVEGFRSDLSLFNGIYARDVESANHTHSMYRRRAGKRFLTFSAEPVLYNPKAAKWRFVEPADQTAVQLLPDIISSECAAPAEVGADLSPSCSSEWIVDAGGHATFLLDEILSLRCLSVDEKLEMTHRQRSSGSSTKIPTGPDSFMPARCEDIKMVEQLSGYTCDQLARAVGCDFLLAETGHKLPAFLPADATVAFVCPETCDQCVECSAGCAVWFLGNNYCDPSCDNEACNFDEGDCTGDLTYAKAEDRLLEPVEEAASTDSEECADDPMVIQMGFSCQLLKMGSSLPGFPGCEMTLVDLARSQGLEISLPSGVPESARILDACPVTCDCCACDRLKRGADGQSVMSTGAAAGSTASAGGSTEVTACSDSDIVEDQSGFTCGEIYHLLGRCDITLGDLGYLPEGMEDTISLEQLCPFSCGVCSNPRLTPYKCHDFPALQKMSGFSCEQAVSLLTPSVCSKVLSSFGYALPAAIPQDTTLSAVCGETCNTCVEEEATTQVAETPVLACEDSDFIFDITGFECHALVELQGDCTMPLESLGYVVPDTVPADATLGQACPRSCHMCPQPATGTCEDSSIVTTDLKQTCSTLISMDGCASLVSASSVIKNVPASLGSEIRIGDLCRASCGYCGDVSSIASPSESTCRDHPAVEQAGYSCTLFLQFASDGCQTPLLRLLGRGASLPAGVPASTTIQDACPKTCNVCRSTDDHTAIPATCEDSPVLNAVSLSCNQVIAMAGGDGVGCVQTVTSIAGNTPITSMLPEGMRIMDLCKRSCKLCDAPSCDDGYLNGNETSIDCGGDSCRPCRSCSSTALKQFSQGIITVPVDTEDFSDGAQRIVGCSDGYQSTSASVETIVCSDGVWSTPKTKCEERTIQLWRGTIGLTHGAEFDFGIVKPVLSAFTTVLQLVDPQIDVTTVRIAAAGSCSAMTPTSSGDCEDNALVEEMGFGCSMLAGLGCSQSLAGLAAIQGTPLPAGIPNDALVSDACPVTCDACEESMARMAEYLAAVGDSSDPLGADCFKADLLIQSEEDIPVKLQSVLGNVATVTKLVAAAFRDALVDSNVTIFTNFTAIASPDESVVPRTKQSALSFVAARPVDILIQGPIAESSGFDLGGDTSSSNAGGTSSALFLPLERENVTLSSWEAALKPNSPVSRARAIFRSSGIKPSPQFSISLASLQAGFSPPIRTDLLSADLTGHYYGEPPLGAVIGPEVARIRKCEDTCCEFKEAFQTYLDGPCGSLLVFALPTEQDLASFCRVPESEEGVLSCMSEGLTTIHAFRDRGEPGCQAADAALQLLDAVCAQNTVTGAHCLLSMESDLKGISYDSLTLKSEEELDLICDAESCARSHFKYLSAVMTLSVAYSLETYDGDNSNLRLLRTNDDVNVKLRAQFAKFQPQRKLYDAVKNNFNLPTLDRLNEWMQANHPEGARSLSGAIPRSLSADEETSQWILPLDQMGESLLDVICVKVNDDYCQQTLQLLAEVNPISSPGIVESPCSSECFKAVTGRIGEVLVRQGQDFKAPRQLALGTLMTHFSRFGCLMSQKNVKCRDAVQKGPFNYASVFNASVTSWPTTSDCTCLSSFIGDGQCDRECFNPQCGFDNKDCLVWTMFPETVANLLSTLCLESLDDRCNPLLSNFNCALCKARVTTCLSNHGCCYAGALESLRVTLQAQKDLMVSIQEMSGLNSITTFYDAFDLERVPTWYEKNCSLSLDRTCVHDATYTQHRVSLEISNLREQSNRRRLQSTQVETLTAFMQDPATINRLASFFHLVPSDLGRVLVRPMKDDRTLLEIDIDSGRYHERELMAEKAKLPKFIMSVLQEAPSFWNNVVNKTMMPEIIVNSIQTVQVNDNQTSSTLDGAWGMGRYTPALNLASCPASTVWSLAGKGMMLTRSVDISKDASMVPHGTSVSVTCVSGYVASSTEGGTLKCDNGLWVFEKSFSCLLPCSHDPLEALGLSSHSIYVQPVASNRLTQLFSPRDLAKQSILTPGTKYPSGVAILLSCADSHTANIASDWGVTTTICQNGKWSKASLDCQPPCSQTPSFTRDLPQAYIMSNTKEVRYGGTRGIECSPDYFAIPPSYEGTSTTIRCDRDGLWTEPPFRCVAGLTIDPTGGLNTVQKMLRTLFSTTGILSLVIFFISMVIIVIFIALFWKFFYRTKADKAYAEQRRLLREYLASTVTGATTTESAEGGYFGTANDDQQDEWHGRSPSSSTVSAVRRVVLLAGTSVLNHPSQ